MPGGIFPPIAMAGAQIFPLQTGTRNIGDGCRRTFIWANRRSRSLRVEPTNGAIIGASNRACSKAQGDLYSTLSAKKSHVVTSSKRIPKIQATAIQVVN